MYLVIFLLSLFSSELVNSEQVSLSYYVSQPDCVSSCVPALGPFYLLSLLSVIALLPSLPPSSPMSGFVAPKENVTFPSS